MSSNLKPHSNKIFESFLSKLDAALELPLDLRSKAIDSCLTELQDFPKELQNSDYFYLQGYILYLMQPQQLKAAQISFATALTLNPNNEYARFYLGHCLYDLKQYKEAKTHFMSVDKIKLEDFLQMKADEMILCCEIKLYGLKERILKKIRKIINTYSKQNYLDDYLFELSKVLQESGISLKDFIVKHKTGE